MEYSLWNGQREELYRGVVEAFSPTPVLLAMGHFAEGTGGQTYWYHLDGRGSVAGLTKHLGQSTHNYRYDAYGQVLPGQGNFTDPHNHYTFLGKEWDENLGLYEFGVRLYDPWVGLWLTPEPLPGDAWRPRTWQRYGYAFANPVSYYDAYGMQPPLVTPSSTLEPTLTPPRLPAPKPVPQRAPTPPYTPTPTPSGAQCSPQPPWWSDRLWWSSAFSKAALTFDALAVLLAGAEAVITDVAAVLLIGGFAVAGAGAGGVGAIPGTFVGLQIAWTLDVAIASSSALAVPENILGIAAFGATLASDILAGHTSFTEEGIAIGQDTLISARNMLLGFIPESNIDLAISASQLRYDIQRNFMGRPGGSVVFTSPTDPEAWRRLIQIVLKEW